MKTWLVNSNNKAESANPNGFKYMLRQNKAAAFYDRAPGIDKIKKGDLVCLYHNENRIIAVGAVVKPYGGHDFDEITKIEHWVDVNWLWKATFDDKDNPINPIDRNTIGITMVNGTVVNVTKQINYKELLSQMSSNQEF